ncbi:MAG: hypothetical protein IPK59_16560 [Rhodospirillaceae bacterium]|nr:hypothetical protein [Rhodospirillaceae bacterium]
MTALLAAAAFLPGCDTTTIPAFVSGTTAYAVVEGVSLNQTGKTASDHLASIATGNDCSLIDYTKTGKYCRTAAEIAQEQAEKTRPYPGFCHRQRANVVCYDTPDRTATNEVDIYPVPR